MQLLQQVQHPVVQAKNGLVGLPLNRSLVLGAAAIESIQLPYQLQGQWGAIYDAVTIPAVIVKIKMKANGCLFAVLKNLSDHPVSLTPRRMLAYVHADLSAVKDADGLSVKFKTPLLRARVAAVDLSTVSELKATYAAVFDTTCSKPTVAMKELAIGLQDFEQKRPLNWGSEGRWQPMSLVTKELLDAEVANLEARGIIKAMQVSEKSFNSQALALPKPDGKSVRLTLDCRRINTYFKAWTAPLVPVAQLLATIPVSWKYFSVIDVKDGFFNIPLAEDIQSYFSFSIDTKRYKFQRLVQGFNGSACIFHSLMGQVIEGLGALHYIDDILLGAETKELHNRKLHALFGRLSKFGFKVKAAKIQLLQTQVQYVGYSLTKGEYSLLPYIQKRVADLPILNGRKALQKAIGVMNVLKASTPDFAAKLQPFYTLLAAVGTIVDWSAWQLKFQRVVASLLQANVRLAIVNKNESFHLYTDWSGQASGYVLCQGGRPVLLGSTRNEGWKATCSSFMGETLTVVWALKQVHALTYGHQLYVHTDSSATALKLQKASSWFKDGDLKLARMLGYIERNYAVGGLLKIVHIEGQDNVLADLLSRWVAVPVKNTTVAALSDPTMEAALKEAHRGHYGADNMKLLLEVQGHNIQMNTIRDWIADCEVCQRFATVGRGVALGAMETEGKKNAVVALDVVGPFPRAAKGERFVITMIDHMTRFAIAVASQKADNVAVRAVLEYWKRNYDLPQKILVDQAQAFMSHHVRMWLRQQAVEVFYTPPYSHKSAGMVERYHRTLEGRIRSLILEQGKTVNQWEQVLQEAAYLIRRMPHSITGYSPAVLFLGTHEDGSSVEREELKKMMELTHKRTQLMRDKYYPKATKQTLLNLAPLQHVWCYDFRRISKEGKKLLPHWTGPFAFGRYLSDTRCELQKWVRVRWQSFTTHLDFVRPCLPVRSF